MVGLRVSEQTKGDPTGSPFCFIFTLDYYGIITFLDWPSTTMM